MTWGNRLFWGIIVFIGINLFWIGLLERFAPVWIGTILGIAFIVGYLKYGPRPKDEHVE